jgi:hypothetical protein
MKNIEATATGPLRPRRNAWRWPLIVVTFLIGHVLLMAIACTIAMRDKTFAVVPDYYGRALEWDQQKSAKIASGKLGWHVEVQAGRQVDARGRRTVSFVLTGAKGKPVEGATLEAVYFHHAHADQIQHVTLTADSNDPRRFTAQVPMAFEGNWEFHFSVTARGQNFVSSTVEYLENQ